MKNVIAGLLALTVAGFSLNSFAVAAVTITGEPVMLEKRGDIYYTPGTYKTTSTYNYVTVDGTKRVCYADRQTTFKMNPITLQVNVAGTTQTWNCYNADSADFVISK